MPVSGVLPLTPRSHFRPCSFRFPRRRIRAFRIASLARSTIEVVAPVPYGWFAQWADTRWKKRGAGYDQFKQYFNQRLRDELERQVPAVRGYIDYTELSTPLSTRHFANYAQGGIYGLSAVPARFRLRDLGARTPVRNLYLTGVDVTTLGVAGHCSAALSPRRWSSAGI